MGLPMENETAKRTAGRGKNAKQRGNTNGEVPGKGKKTRTRPHRVRC